MTENTALFLKLMNFAPPLFDCTHAVQECMYEMKPFLAPLSLLTPAGVNIAAVITMCASGSYIYTHCFPCA